MTWTHTSLDPIESLAIIALSLLAYAAWSLFLRRML
jgi:hypothetical protein